ALCGLAALVAIGLAGFFTFKHLTAKPKSAAVAAVSPAAKPSPTVPATKTNDILMPLADPNKASSGTVSAHPSISPVSSPPVWISAPAPTPAATVAHHEPKTDSQAKDADKSLSKAAR